MKDRVRVRGWVYACARVPALQGPRVWAGEGRGGGASTMAHPTTAHARARARARATDLGFKLSYESLNSRSVQYQLFLAIQTDCKRFYSFLGPYINSCRN